MQASYVPVHNTMLMLRLAINAFRDGLMYIPECLTTKHNDMFVSAGIGLGWGFGLQQYTPVCGCRLFEPFARTVPFGAGALPRPCRSETDPHLPAAGTRNRVAAMRGGRQGGSKVWLLACRNLPTYVH